MKELIHTIQYDFLYKKYKIGLGAAADNNNEFYVFKYHKWKWIDKPQEQNKLKTILLFLKEEK